MGALHFSDDNFDTDVLASKKPVMVDFYADWCGPCKMMEPHIEALATELDGKAIVAKLDVDANQATSMKFGVMSIPTTIIFKSGTEAKRLVGYQDKDTLIKAIE